MLKILRAKNETTRRGEDRKDGDDREMRKMEIVKT